ncbi:putative perakine reductase [Dioscorea sansibarensis]
MQWSNLPNCECTAVLGIGIVTYSPLGGGFFAGKAVVENLPPKSILIFSPLKLVLLMCFFRVWHPKFSGHNLEKNKILYAYLTKLSKKHHCTPSQLALAWLLHQGSDVVPIPGNLKYFLSSYNMNYKITAKI